MNKYKLLGIMAEKNITQYQLAKMVGMSKNAMCLKINGHTKFTVDEAAGICKALCLNDDKTIVDIFLR